MQVARTFTRPISVRSSTRAFSTTRSLLQALTSTQQPPAKSYPFSAVVSTPPPSTEPLNPKLFYGKGLMQHLHQTLPTSKARNYMAMFARRDIHRVRTGSVLTIELEHPPYSFSGVLMGIRRKGVDTSILLRNIVQKTGVEMQFFLSSPGIKNIKIIQRAGGEAPPGEEGVRMGKAMARSKLYFLRDQPLKMSAISAGIARKKK